MNGLANAAAGTMVSSSSFKVEGVVEVETGEATDETEGDDPGETTEAGDAEAADDGVATGAACWVDDGSLCRTYRRQQKRRRGRMQAYLVIIMK